MIAHRISQVNTFYAHMTYLFSLDVCVCNPTFCIDFYLQLSEEFNRLRMQPKSITWADGRTFPIDAVRDFRPAGAANNDFSGDCFTVLIQGQEKHLFFEHIDRRFSGRIGRWFVEKAAQ